MQISLGLALFATVSLAWFVSTHPVMANGATNIELFSKVEGPIQIVVFSRDASHLVGQLSLSVHVLENNVPIEAKEIVIQVEGSDGGRYIAHGSISSILPVHYDVSVPVTATGDYNLKPIIKLDHSTIDGSFIVTVSDTKINWEIIASILVGVLLILPAIIIVSKK
ncbi:MAG: hypothetical protein DK304_000127 [Chloroflexi bacterium]|jgi:hypothetical protein|nr:MAG: hypothetical protein DK304_000127 [Chloroflexota bacterium]